MYLAFFPQEDNDHLMELRDNLTPFLKAVSKGLSVELENGNLGLDDKMSMFEEILLNVPTENSASNSSAPSSQTADTLHLEFDNLLGLQWVFEILFINFTFSDPFNT